MPIVHSLDKTMKTRIDEFYGNASVFRPNKFLVGFYGEYVRQAVKKLKSDSEYARLASNQLTSSKKLSLGEPVYRNALDNWIQKHYHDNEEQVEMKWTCSGVEIPSVQTKTNNSLMLDGIKSIKYPLVIGGSEDTQQIKINVIEDRNMMMYQFFNALMNRFFTPQILKPRSSFHKLGMYIAVLQEDFVIPKGDSETIPRDKDLDAIVSHIFEFNSVVMGGIPPLNFNNKIDAPLTYSINFYAPNTFQGSFKTTFKGLRNNSSDQVYLDAVDGKGLQKNGQEYIRKNFEVGYNDLTTTTNGVYEKTLEPE